MASGGGQAEPERLDPAKLAAYPKILDIDNDILIPQYADRWMAQLKVALRSRYLIEVLEYPEDPSLQSFVEHYAAQGLDTSDITAYHDMVLAKRHDKKQSAAAQLHALIKDEVLTHMEALEMWLASAQYRAWKPKKIESVAREPPARPQEAVDHDKAFATQPKKQQISLKKELVNQLAAEDEHDSSES